MVSNGDRAPGFELPAVVDGGIQTVALDDYLGTDIVVLAFYPSDFNPACADGATDLDELDLFTMQKDVAVLGISADSVYSHRAFAEEYDLTVPLLADVRGEVAAEYGATVADPDAGYLTRRAVVVIGPGGEVEYVWRADGLHHLPNVDEVRSAVEAAGGGDTAFSRYRIGHAHYVEGRRAFTSGMGEFESREWMLAQGDFERAHEEFEEAADHFNTAARFADDEGQITYYERGERKAQALWQAAEWLAQSANAFASGEGAEGEQLRSDAETPLETAREIHEPPDPDEFPPDEEPGGTTAGAERFVLPTAADDGPPSLDVEIDEAVSEPEDGQAAPEAGDGPQSTPDRGGEEGATPEAEAEDELRGPADDGDDEGRIDEEELDEITAEIEEQTKRAQAEQGDEPADEDGGDEEAEREATGEGSTGTSDTP